MKRTGGFVATVLTIDAVTAFLVTLIFIIPFDDAYVEAANPILPSLVIAVISVVVLICLQTQKFIWRFISRFEIAPFSAAALIVVGCGNVALFALGQIPQSSISTIWLAARFLLFGLIHAGLLAGAWLSVRFVWRVMQDLVDTATGDEVEVRRVLLVSAGVGCVHLLRGLEGSTSPLCPVGILDFNPQQVGREVRGLPILGTPSQLDSIVASLAAKGQRPEEVVLTEPLPEDLMVDVIERGVALKLKVSKLPSPGEARELIGRGLSPTEPVTLRTIIGRQQLEFDRTPIMTLLAGKRILVTGAGGSIGSQLVKLIASFGPEHLCLVDNGEYNLWKIEQDLKAQFPDVACVPRLTDIRDINRLRSVFAESRPDLVFHAAALKHVPIVEANPGEGVMTNIIGTRNVADVSLEAGVQAMVQVSTDKAVMPTSVMGATKRMAEIYCQSLDLGQSGPRFLTVRFGNVLGSSGSVVPIFEQQILAGGPVTVTHPQMERFFMTIAEACELILHSAAYSARDASARGVINVLDMGKSVKILDVARRMILLHGMRPDEDIKIAFSGVRPGEKLREDLFNDGEVRLQSSVVGVQRALSQGFPLDHINAVIERLAALAAAGDNGEIMKTLEAIVKRDDAA